MIIPNRDCNHHLHTKPIKIISILVIIFVYFVAENSKTQSRKHERLKARNKTIFTLSCFRDYFFLQTCWVSACPGWEIAKNTKKLAN